MQLERNMARMRSKLAIAIGAMMLAGAPALAQEAGFDPPETAWGAPDLQGFWTNSSITNLERSPEYPNLVLTPEEAARMEGNDYYNNRTREDAKRIDVEKAELLDGTDLLSGGGYNAFWVDPGTKVGMVKGELRSSWIIEPAHGRIPRIGRDIEAENRARAAAAERAKELGGAGTAIGPGGVNRQAGGGYGSYDGPETRPIGERCLIGFGNTGGPVMNNVLYNNVKQIVQSPDYVMILVEMAHDARIIPLTKDRKRPEVIEQWLGDSIGWYEGDKLVVETRNVNPIQRGYISDEGYVIEKFSRWHDDQILYEFEVVDPTRYTQPWKGEIAWNRSNEPLHEYACHEGNYSFAGILAGARELERQGRLVPINADEEG